MTDFILGHLEDKVKLIFKKEQKDFKDEENLDDIDSEKKQSNNKIPKHIRKLFNQKRNTRRKIMKTTSASKCLALRIKIQSIEEQLKGNYLKRRRKLEKEAISKTKKNSKAFFAFAKKFSKTSTGVGPIITKDCKVVTEPKEIAELQKEQYDKVFTKPNKEAKIDNAAEFFSKESTNDNMIENILFTYMDVREAIDKLSVNAAAGPDGVPAILLKKCKDVWSHPLACLWQKSLLTGEIPDIFKLAFITPIYKAGSSRASPENYRPVSLTSHLVKSFERILKKSLQNFLEVTLALADQQHGFRQKKRAASASFLVTRTGATPGLLNRVMVKEIC